MKKHGITNLEKQAPNRVITFGSSHKHHKTRIENICKPCAHIPTLRCHQDVMSRSEPRASLASKESDQISNENRRECVRSCLKSEANFNDYESNSVSWPSNLQERTNQRSKGAQSMPLLAHLDLENSVDTIPVKLTSLDKFQTKEQNRTKPKKYRAKQSNNKEKREVNLRTTWSELLKGENKDLFQSKERSRMTNVKPSDTVVTSQKKKVSISESRPEQQNCDTCSSKLTDYPNDLKQLVHSASDPIVTLDFLIKQLRERLLKQQNNNLEKIVLDMENALLKISYGNQANGKEVNGENVLHKTDSSSSSNIACKTTADINENDKTHQPINTETNLNKNKLEESCFYLQSLCMKQKENVSNKNTCEKDQLTIQLAESRRLLAVAKTREKDYEKTIGELRLKIQESASKIEKQSESMQLQNDTISRLRAENEVLAAYKDSVRRLNSRLKEVSRENEMLNSQIYIKELEITKLKVLLEAKDSCKSSKLPKTDRRNNLLTEPQVNLLEEDKDTTLSSVSSWPEEKAAIACSSQASSSPRHSPSPYNSWQNVSAIQQEPRFSNDIGNIFKNLGQKNEQVEPPKLDLELPSSSESWWSHEDDDKPGVSDVESGTMSIG